jgi:hypothetical protein
MGEACLIDHDCPGRNMCVSGQCLFPCADNEHCFDGQVCRQGACRPTECGDGIREGYEHCDHGAATETCSATCEFIACGTNRYFTRDAAGVSCRSLHPCDTGRHDCKDGAVCAPRGAGYACICSDDDPGGEGACSGAGG